MIEFARKLRVISGSLGRGIEGKEFAMILGDRDGVCEKVLCDCVGRNKREIGRDNLFEDIVSDVFRLCNDSELTWNVCPLIRFESEIRGRETMNLRVEIVRNTVAHQ